MNVSDNTQCELWMVILPVLITAIVSLITLIVNSIIKVAIDAKKYNSEQFKVMQSLYPELKLKIINIMLVLNDVQNNQLFSKLSDSLNVYIEYNCDDSMYRDNHEDHVEHIDDFIYSIDLFIEQMSELKSFFDHIFIPAVPVFHPILKYKINKMLSTLQYYSLIVCQCSEDNISTDLIIKEIENYKPIRDCEFDSSLLSDYIKIIDKWFMSY